MDMWPESDTWIPLAYLMLSWGTAAKDTTVLRHSFTFQEDA